MGKERTHEVDVDVCKEHGIWLDKGELTKILIDAKKSSGKAAAARARKKGRYEGIFFGWLSFFLPK
jgi:Zn-finger nucleic acid-binding protein